jgi:hypothetical protein
MAAQGYQSNTPPVDLVHAVGGKVSSDYNRLPEGGCHKLLSLGKRGKGDYTWGYRIYRTTYHKPNSDADFARAIEVLNEYIRAECFKYSNGDRVPEYIDSEANRQLWQRAKHDIVQDPGVLEGASKSPEKMLKLHQDWVHSHPGAKVTDYSFYRYFLVVDDEVINHLLQLPMPAKYEKTIPASYAIKLFDAWFNIGSEIYGDDDMELESDEDEDMSEEEEKMTKAEDFIDVEGWFWVGVFNLVSFWMCEDNAAVEELSTSDKSWGGKRRPVHVSTSFPLEGCGDAECRAMNHGFTLDEDVAGGE